jgi:hypothetical protein
MAAAGRSGRGRALFVALSTGQTLEYDLPLDVGTSAWIDPSPCVRKLLCVHERSRAAGAIVADGRHLRVYEWHAGALNELVSIERMSWRDRSETLGTASRQSSRELVQSIEQHELSQWLDDATEQVCQIIHQRDWSEVVVIADDQLRRGLIARCGATVTFLPVGANQGNQRLEQTTELVSGKLAEYRAAERTHTVRDVLDRAELPGAPAAAGPEQVIEHLRAGRVDTLFYHTDCRLHIDRESMEFLQSDGAGHADGYHGIERLIHQALATRARVVVVNGEAGHSLLDHGSVAARLRW